jgi:DNA-binding transcriptional LysR family regulator
MSSVCVAVCVWSGIFRYASNLLDADLRTEDFIFREPGSATRQFLEHLLQSQSLQVNVSMELPGNKTVKQAVMVGMGISFLSVHVFQVELADGAGFAACRM